MEEKGNNAKIIDLHKVWRAMRREKKLYYKVLPIVFVLSCVWIFPQPRYYETSVSLAPESGGGENGGLASIASSFGLSIGGMDGGGDAIYPILYPELFESPEFLVSLFDIQVTTDDGELTTDYYTYLREHQKKNWLTKPFTDAVRWMKMLFAEKRPDVGGGAAGKINPFRMSEDDDALMNLVKESIKCAVDKKTDVTTISVQDQDPLVCAIIADSVKQRLQDFIIQYRTSKARLDVEYYQKLSTQALADYEDAVKKYSDYCDSHKNVILQVNISERDELENKMSSKFNTYNAMNLQMEAAKAKVQERTPSFTTLKSASVPIKPAGPKRMLFVLGMLILAAFITSLYAARDEFFVQSNQTSH